MTYKEDRNPEEQNNTETSNAQMIDKAIYERMATEYTEQINSLQDKYARLFADIENMKRRAIEEQRAASERIEKKIFLDLLPVIDNFERAMQTINTSGMQQSGFNLIYGLFQKFLKQHDIREIETSDMFDPELHEAISQVSDEQKESGSIVQVFEKGYYLHNKVLRHAKVSVVG